VRVQRPAGYLRGLRLTIPRLPGWLRSPRYPQMGSEPLAQNHLEARFFQKIGPLGSCAGTTTLHPRQQQYLQRQSRSKEI